MAVLAILLLAGILGQCARSAAAAEEMATQGRQAEWSVPLTREQILVRVFVWLAGTTGVVCTAAGLVG